MKVIIEGDINAMRDNFTKGMFEIAMRYIKEGKGIEPKRKVESSKNKETPLKSRKLSK